MMTECFLNRIIAVLRGDGEKTYRAFDFSNNKNSLIEVYVTQFVFCLVHMLFPLSRLVSLPPSLLYMY